MNTRTLLSVSLLALLGALVLPPPLFAGAGSLWEAEVKGMSCPLCAKNIEKQLSKIEGLVEVKIDLGNGIVKIRYAAGFRGSAGEITRAITDAGFTAAAVRDISP